MKFLNHVTVNDKFIHHTKVAERGPMASWAAAICLTDFISFTVEFYLKNTSWRPTYFSIAVPDECMVSWKDFAVKDAIALWGSCSSNWSTNFHRLL